MATDQRGFTLVEIAIVLVIIGMILGGILSGQNLIRSTQAKDAIAIAGDLQTATTYFKQRYNYLPGDLPNPAADITVVPALVAGTGGTIGNGLIEGAIAAGTGFATLGSEVAVAPLQLYSAGFLGKVDIGNPQHIVNTSFGPVHLATPAASGVAGYAAANPAVRNVIVFVNLTCDVAREMDIKIDDGNLTTGKAIGTACVGDIVTRYAVAL